jgi:membrane peptidoglycan carboxypeptidase
MSAIRSAGSVAQRLGNPELWSTVIVRVALFCVLIAGTALLLAASFAPVAGLVSGTVGFLDAELFDYPPLPDDLGEPTERSVILARDGSVLAVLHDVENREIVALDEVPAHVQDAVIATEDAEFRHHGGVDWQAIGRAAVGNVQAGEVTSGGSTITQQLVKQLVVGADQTLDRKLREAMYAMELEQRLSKDQILEAYLNQAYFANGVYGIGTAAEFYWGKSVGDLTIDEAALLAGIIRTPARNDPVRHPLAAVQRRNIVLDQMARAGFITAEDAEAHKWLPLDLDIHRSTTTQPFFVDYVVHLLKQDPALGADRGARQDALLRGGLTIHTTLDPRLTDIAAQVIAEVLDRPDDPLAALTAVNPTTGEILAVAIGPKPYGDGPGQTKVNPAVAGLGGSGRQPGSAFKTFEVVAALEEGISPAFTIDTPSPYEPTGECAELDPDWSPGNYSDSGGGVMDMAEATARSSNVYFSALVDLTGPDALADAARRMGIRSTPLRDGICSTVLGGQEVFPLDMAAAFGTLANGGTYCQPYAVSQVVDRRGRTIMRGDQRCEQAIDDGIAARATALLRGPIENGTASRNGKLGRPAAGKTGTTDDHRDAWFVGYVPQLSTAAWVGHEVPQPLSHPTCGGSVTGGCLPTIIWQRFMSRSLEALNLPVEDFPRPPPLPTGTVPDVLGDDEETAREKLAEASFSAVTREVPHWQPAGTVVAQDPEGGTTTETGTAVVLDISDGQGPQPELPSLIGLTLDEADAQLTAMGVPGEAFEVGVHDESLYGIVISQSPAVGTSLDHVTTVTLHIGRPRRPGDDPPPPPSAGPPPPDAEPPPSGQDGSAGNGEPGADGPPGQGRGRGRGGPEED